MITQELIAEILQDRKLINRRTDFHEEIDEIREELEPHFDDEYPEKLLFEFRTSEEDWMKAERKKGWQNPTKPAVAKIENLLHKIRQADDFAIVFPSDSEADTGLTRQNSFKDYLTKNLPVVKNLEDWLFQVFQKAYLSDPNAIVYVGPDPEDVLIGDLGKVWPQIISSEYLVSFGPEGAIWELESEKINGKKAKRFFMVDETDAGYFYYFEQDVKGDSDPINFTFEVFPGIFNSVPVHQVGSVVYEIEDNKPIYESLLQPALSPWQIAMRRQDDNEIIWIKSAYPKEWEIANGSCKTCKGSGTTADGKSTCKTCDGKGHTVKESPFIKKVINITTPNALNPNAPTIPTPPIGIVERPIDILREFREEIDSQIMKGLKALNLENIGLVPLATSGESKIQDKKEVHTLLYQVAVWYATIYEWTAAQIYSQLYGGLINNGLLTEEQKAATLPKIVVPTEFDILTAQDLAESLAFAKKNNLGAQVVNGLIRSLTAKIHGEDSEPVKQAEAMAKLDPLPNMTIDEVVLAKEAGLISEVDALLKIRIESFVNQKVAETDGAWWRLPFIEKQASLYELAQKESDKIKATRINAIDLRA